MICYEIEGWCVILFNSFAIWVPLGTHTMAIISQWGPDYTRWEQKPLPRQLFVDPCLVPNKPPGNHNGRQQIGRLIYFRYFDSVCRFSLFFNKFIYLFVFIFGCVGSLLLCVGFLQLRGVGATLLCGAWTCHCCGFSCCRAQALGMRASVVVAHGLSSCGSWALELRLSSCGAWA